MDSAPGRGTRIDVFFPEVRGTGAEPDAGAREATVIAPPSAATILVVEDEAGVRTLAERVLENEGYRVVSASSGSEALAALDSLDELPRLLITDMVMPGMDGRVLAEKLRRKCPDCRVLLMSGYTEDVVIREHKLGPDTSFLAKPFTPTDLSRRVAELLADRPEG